MSKSPSEAAHELAATLAVMLEKYEIHNEMLAIELAIFVIGREKDAVNQSYGKFEQILAGIR